MERLGWSGSRSNRDGPGARHQCSNDLDPVVTAHSSTQCLFTRRYPGKIGLGTWPMKHNRHRLPHRRCLLHLRPSPHPRNPIMRSLAHFLPPTALPYSPQSTKFRNEWSTACGKLSLLPYSRPRHLQRRKQRKTTLSLLLPPKSPIPNLEAATCRRAKGSSNGGVPEWTRFPAFRLI